MSSEIEYISGWHVSSRPKWRVFSGDLPPSCLTLQLSQSLGTAGTCAEGQMCTDRAHRVSVPQSGQRRFTGTAQQHRPRASAIIFNSSSAHRQVSVKARRHCQIHRHRNTQTQHRDCLLSLCCRGRSLILWGVQSEQV